MMLSYKSCIDSEKVKFVHVGVWLMFSRTCYTPTQLSTPPIHPQIAQSNNLGDDKRCSYYS